MMLPMFWKAGRLALMVLHLWSQYSPADPDTQRRQKIAYWSWAKQPWHELPVVEQELKRVWIENDKHVPFIKDLFNVGCQGSKDEDIVCYTNADLIVRSDACLQIAAALQETDAAYSYRF